ncbi:portal protein [Acinetobacter phage vB_ApiM_fHyAci03]|uniref:Portal protein n=1 Tax=Acinetobacter phage vB_ApiM_fHyAci03 TaxID=2269366 RepID=A0A345AV12_9CAUD|nr:portal protein [Acinetobacter phage vB_ApiM_fHyAci03]AXF40745.1 portal vertex protein [Acinetobacter phage vB_ApiM_fHyAci03]
MQDVNDLKMFAFWQKVDTAEYDQIINNKAESITAPKFDDGATEIESTDAAYNGVFRQLYGNQDPNVTSTKELINTYRSMLNNYEVDNAVQEIVSDAVVYEDGYDVVSLDLDQTKFSENIREKILEEFNEVLNMLKFQRKGSDHFRRWYVDSRIFFHKIINPSRPKDGIIELRRLDPRQVQFIREIETVTEKGVKVVKGYREYFIYDTQNDSYNCGGQHFAAGTKVKIPYSAMVYAHSGLTDCCGKNIIGYLHRAVKPANQLKLLEDAMMIYRLTRAPDRRVFYIDTGNMPARKAAQYMQHIMNSHRNRISYDASTGKIKNQANMMALTEDYWLQRRDGKAVTEVDTLPGMSGMNEMDDVLYFRKALYMALRVPLSRIPDEQSQNVFDMSTAISRDELRFDKFIMELQHKFEEVFLNPLKSNLLLKRIIDEDEWENEINNIKVVFHKNSYFTEMKEMEIMERRVNALNLVEPYVGKYISNQTAMKQFLHMSDEEIAAERKIIDEELKDKVYNPPEEEL